jgi:transposase
MPRYKQTDASNGQGLFLSVNLREQLLPGSFEEMLDKVIGTKIDTSIFDRKYNNDHSGAKAIPPSVLLKLIIYGYSKGQKSSRSIWKLSRENIIAKALTGDMDIHWTTIADFISGNSKEFNGIFIKVLAYCNELGLIGGETFAIDGLRLPSNASIEMSGTKEQLEKRVLLYRKMAEKHLTRHLKKDERGETDAEEKKRFEQRQRHLARRIDKISCFLDEMVEKPGTKVQEIRSNVTDNESAMIHSSQGFIQGYIGLAVSDHKKQIIVSAQAIGSSCETEYLPEMLDKNASNLHESGVGAGGKEKKITMLGDSHYFSEQNLRACAERGIEAVIPDVQEKRRKDIDGQKWYQTHDFTYSEAENYYVCPQGKRLAYRGTTTLGGREGKRYEASAVDCKTCPDLSCCIRSKKEQSTLGHGRRLLITKSNEPGSLSLKMREKLTTEEYQEKYAHRIQIIEPVFANIGYCKGLKRFTLRGKEKVNGQWLLYCIVHNLGKCLNGYNINRDSA